MFSKEGGKYHSTLKTTETLFQTLSKQSLVLQILNDILNLKGF